MLEWVPIKKDDDDYLEEMLHKNGQDVLLKNAKGLENFERVKSAASKSLYCIEMGCLTH